MANSTEKLAETLPLADDMADTPANAPHHGRENITMFPSSENQNQLRILEALLFAASEPLDEATLAERLPKGADVAALIAQLAEQYRMRGVNLTRVAGKWAFRTAEDLSFIMRKDAHEEKRLSRAALETLAIIAYHQPVTRAEIEDVRGVSISKGTLDAIMEIGWIRMRGRRRTPGRPVTYGTTEAFMNHFALADIKDLPGISDLKAAGLLDSDVPSDFIVPDPSATDDLADDEDPLEDGELDEFDPDDFEAPDEDPD